MVEAAAARKDNDMSMSPERPRRTPWHGMLLAAANRRGVWFCTNTDGTVDLSPFGQKGCYLARGLTMTEAIDFLDAMGR
jgi:hypothetical protein